MTRVVPLALFLALVTSDPLAAAPAPTPDPVTMGDFVKRCESDPNFCRIRLMATAEILERNRKLCPRTTSKEAMAARVAAVMDSVLEEDEESFKNVDYRTIAEQLLVFLWPCEPIS